MRKQDNKGEFRPLTLQDIINSDPDEGIIPNAGFKERDIPKYGWTYAEEVAKLDRQRENTKLTHARSLEKGGNIFVGS